MDKNLTMLTDFYQLTMANGYFENGMADTIAYFDMFFRKVPDDGGYAIMAGVEQMVEYLKNLHFTDEDIAYYTDCRADREQKDESARPEIATAVENMDEYDTVIIAHPIWHGIAPRIISTFLESYDFSGKTLLTFCTSASSPLGQSAKQLQELTPNSTWLESKRFAIGTSREEIEEWLEDVLRP